MMMDFRASKFPIDFSLIVSVTPLTMIIATIQLLIDWQAGTPDVSPSRAMMPRWN